jgi:hypothetical protein
MFTSLFRSGSSAPASLPFGPDLAVLHCYLMLELVRAHRASGFASSPRITGSPVERHQKILP